ncbi:putative baseplate J family protein [Bacillus phage BCD7]|uniref:Putative baseplate J family protein n=1 Tax=Bacillus phage BCD7 TaxID=1136534 RepID=J9PV89_9CAUD|nr:putative baseplate J family protein [Bacillus phage BCD7]AEZ50529.1 putative baseplate J family protein [Bacillus phage BCD7]
MSEVKQLPIDYVTKDYEGFFQMMKGMIPSLTPEWTDMSESDQGIVILQALSYGLHVLGYYQDKGVNENFLHTATTKRAILLGCKFLGYEPKKQSASVVTLKFTKEAFRKDQYVVVPQRAKVSTNPDLGEPIIFEIDAPLVLPEGVMEGTVTATQGESEIRELVGKGTNQPDQRYRLESAEVLEDTLLVVTNENGKDYTWKLVDNLLESQQTDRHFMTEIDEDNYTTIIFGSGVAGMKPPLDVNIFASYRHGGGNKGNLAPGKINFLYDTSISSIQSVTNEEEAVGGEDSETVEHAREVAPKYNRTLGKAVTVQDHADIAETISGVSRAICKETFDKDNNVNLYIATDEYTPAPQALIDKVAEELNRVRVVNSKLNVYTCMYKEFDMSLKIFLHDGFVASDVKEELQAELLTYLHPRNFELGETIYLSKVIQRTFFVPGIRNVVISSPTGDIASAFNELPKLRNVNITVEGGIQGVQ